jgi:hypothetical protein
MDPIGDVRGRSDVERNADDEMQPVERRLRRYAGIATLLFAGQAVWAVVHLAIGGRYPGYKYVPADVTIDSVLLLAWGLAAVATATRWSRLSLLPLAGCVASLAFGVLASVSIPFSGIPFLLLGMAALYCVFRAMPLFRRPIPAIHRGKVRAPLPIRSADLRPAR